MSGFADERKAFMEEADEYYKTYPADVSEQEKELDRRNKEQPDAAPIVKKTWIYQVIAKQCRVKLFRHCPFYFEVDMGRPRNSVGSAFPPLPGLDSWLMRRDTTGFLEEFQGWVKPYMDQDIIDSTMYVDSAHHALGVENVIKYGFRGIMAKAEEELRHTEDSDKRIFIGALIDTQKALIELTERFSLEARRMLETEKDPAVRKRLERICLSAESCPANPPRTFYEALNTIWYVHQLGNNLEAMGFAVVGHVDRILEEFYVRDISNKTMTREEADDLICWFVSLTDARWDLNNTPYGTNTTINIGGCDAGGSLVFNDITREIIKCYKDYRFVNPKLQARFSKQSPQEYYDLIAGLAASGTNVLSVFNDDVIIPAHERMGKNPEDCRLYVSGGCQEPVLANKEVNSRGYCYLNPSKYLLMMIFPEREEFFRKEHLVPFSLECCLDFESFYKRVFHNLALIVNAITWHYNQFERRWPEYNPCPFFSSTIDGCLESGRDISQGGAVYNDSGFAVSGIGTLIDSLYAIKKAVFEEKKISWEKMKRLLETDFCCEDGELYRNYLLNKVDKYGSDGKEINSFAARVCADTADVTSFMRNSRGGLFEASLWSFYGYEWLKAGTGATPDGRKGGTTLARGMNPSERVETNVVQLIHSLERMDLSKFPQTAVMYFEMPLSLADTDSRIFSDVIHYFMENGGNTFDFDVVDSESLKDAQIHPERHENLVVRVCGYSARFVTLDKEMQDEVINRALRHAG